MDERQWAKFDLDQLLDNQVEGIQSNQQHKRKSINLFEEKQMKDYVVASSG